MPGVKKPSDNLGFRSGLSTVHTSRTIMLEELSLLLEELPPDSPSCTYRSAIIERNVLGKSTRSTRLKTAKYLVELFALDPKVERLPPPSVLLVA